MNYFIFIFVIQRNEFSSLYYFAYFEIIHSETEITRLLARFQSEEVLQAVALTDRIVIAFMVHVDIINADHYGINCRLQANMSSSYRYFFDLL